MIAFTAKKSLSSVAVEQSNDQLVRMG
jgi:hypothetical protein